MRCKYIILFSIVLLLVPSIALALPGPKAYHVQQVRAKYLSDGTIDSGTSYGKCDFNTNPCKYGYLQVAPPNNDDVLQYIRINLSSSNYTTLQSNTSFDSVVANSSAYERVGIYVNTTQGDSGIGYADDAYEINGTGHSQTVPVIEINVTKLTNFLGGDDVYSNDNIYPNGASNPVNYFNFTIKITNNSTKKALKNVNFTIQFDVKIAQPDVINITTTPTSGTASDSDSDGWFDRIEWKGDLNAGSSHTIYFNISTNQTQNFAGDSVQLYDTTDSTEAYYDNTSYTLTESYITDTFSRGPIRQGVDLTVDASTDNWLVRGLIRSMATGTPTSGDALTYNLTGWEIFEINASSGIPLDPDNANKSGDFSSTNGLFDANDSRIYTTDDEFTGDNTWFDTGSGGNKPYYGVSFDWEVVWNDTYNYGYINSTYELPTLYLVDVSPVKSVEGSITPLTADQNATIEDTVQMLGNDNAGVDSVEIFSVVPARPHNKPTLDHGNWTINSNVNVSFWNGTSNSRTYLSEGADYTKTITKPDSTNDVDGFVNITISDVSTVLGDTPKGNDEFNVTIIITSPSSFEAGDIFNFTGNTTVRTESGTPLTERFNDVTLPISAKQLVGWKQLIGNDVTQPNLIDSTIWVEVTSENLTSTVNETKFVDYVPQGTNLATFDDYNESLTIKYYNSTHWSTLEYGDYIISDNGTQTLPDGLLVHVYEISTPGGGWDLGNGEKLNVTYQMNITDPGAYTLPSLISGFDPVTGYEYLVRAIGSIKVTVQEDVMPLEIDEGEFSQAKMAIVNKPVLWMKDFQVYNPNGVPVNSKFSINVFSDTSKGYVSYYDEYGNKVEEDVDFELNKEGKRMIWRSKVKPFESRTYEVRILTPPVMEVDRNVEVLEKLPNKKVKIMMDVFLKNFGMEKYENLALNLPIGYDDMIKARDSFGNELQFSGGKDSTRIMAGDIGPDEMKSINIIYKQPYPTIIVTPEKDEFKVEDPVGLNILVINGGEQVDFPFIEVEIYTPGMEIIKSDVKKIEKMQPLEKTELTEEYFLPLSAPTGLYLASVSFRKDFATLASGTGQFFLTGTEQTLTQTWGWVFLLIVIIFMAWLSHKRLMSTKKKKSYEFKNQVI